MPRVSGPSRASIHREEAGEEKVSGGMGFGDAWKLGEGTSSASSLPSSPSFRAGLPDSSLASEAAASIKHPGHVPALLPAQLQALLPTLASVWGRRDEMGSSTGSSTDFCVSEGPGGPGLRGRGSRNDREDTGAAQGSGSKRLEPGSLGHRSCLGDSWDLRVGQGLSVTLQTDPS